jgi:hypothetical protein
MAHCCRDDHRMLSLQQQLPGSSCWFGTPGLSPWALPHPFPHPCQQQLHSAACTHTR